MKKSLIALAVAGIVAAPVAMAESVTIYGQANVSYDVISNGDAGAVTGTSASKVQSNGSRIGFKGTEDLGGGTSAIWQVESAANLDGSGAQGFASRGSWAGLAGDSWGSVKLGNDDSVAKQATKGFDIFDGALGDVGDTNLLTYNGYNNMIQYTSPNMSGFSFMAQYVAGAETASLSTNTKGSTYALAASYASGPLSVGFGYDTTKGGSAGTGSAAGTVNQTISLTTLGVGYNFNDALYAALSYQRKNDSVGGAGNTNRNNWLASGKYSFGSDAIKLQYAKAGTVNSVTNTGANQVSVGYDHGMSKATTLYAVYTRITNDSGSAYNLGNANGAGADPSGWSIGMKHNF